MFKIEGMMGASNEAHVVSFGIIDGGKSLKSLGDFFLKFYYSLKSDTMPL